MFKTWTQSAFSASGSLRLALTLAVGLGIAAASRSFALELAPPQSSAYEKAPVLVRRLPAVVNQPPAPPNGIELLESGSGELLERLPPAIDDLPSPNGGQDAGESPTGEPELDLIPDDERDDSWSPSDIGSPNDRRSPNDRLSPGDGAAPKKNGNRYPPMKFREPDLHLMDDPVTTFNGNMSGSIPPTYAAPMQAPSTPPAPVDEFLPQTYHPPIDPHAGSIPRAYVPPPVVQSEPAQWSPWWDEPLGRVSLLNAPTVSVNLQELMNLSLRNSPVVQMARSAMSCGDCGKSKSRVDAMLYSVAQGYWETYRLRGVVIVRERLYNDGLNVCRQLKTLVGADNDLTVLAISSARERLADLAAAHEALRKSQNKLASIVSIPRWEQEHELLPMDSPFCRPYRIDEAAELRNALSRRAELQGMMNNIQATSYRPQMVGERGIPHMASYRGHAMMPASPIQVYSHSSPELERISDKIKLEVKNAIVRIAGSYETMHRYSNAAQASAKEIATLQSRCDACTGSSNDLPLLFRDLLDAQSRLANIEQRFVTAQANYSAAILELRRANGTIIDRCTFQRGESVKGPGVSNPRTVNAVWNARPVASEFQSPQEPLGDVRPRESEWLDFEPQPRPQRRPQPQLRRPEPEPAPESFRQEIFAPPNDYDTPQGEFPMPLGEQVVPGTVAPIQLPSPADSSSSMELTPPANRAFQSEPHDVQPNNRVQPYDRLQPYNDLQPYDFEDFGGESSLTPQSPSDRRGRSRGELPMPRGEDIFRPSPPSDLWPELQQPTPPTSSDQPLRQSRRRFWPNLTR